MTSQSKEGGEMAGNGQNDIRGVCIGTIRQGYPSPRYWHSIMALQGWAASKRIRYGFREVCDKNGVATNHNTLNEQFLAENYEWLLMMDADAMIHPMSLERLLSWGKKVVVPLMFRKIPPYLPTVFREPLDLENDIWLQDFRWIKKWLLMHHDQIPDNDQPILFERVDGNPLVEVQRSGTHVMLVHREVLEAIEPPWFERKKESGSGSDFVFCRKVLEAGYKIWCDLSILSGHLMGDYCCGAVDYLLWEPHTHFDPEAAERPRCEVVQTTERVAEEELLDEWPS